MKESVNIGSFGEEMASDFLQAKGFQVVKRNFRCRLGEIDIIATNSKFIVFAEVKLRKNNFYGEPREFVTKSKQRKILLTAQYWLMKHDTLLQPRFDVIEILAPYGISSKIEINHIENAFEVN